MFTSSQYINIIGISHKLMCSSIQLCFSFVATLKLLRLDCLFVETLFLNIFKQSEEGNTFATLTNVVNDRFYTRLFV